MFDIVVIGGNLSGTFAAINAAEKGVRVALVEKHKEPFFPAHCGEAIDDVTAEFLQLDEIGCPKNEINKVIVNVSTLNKFTFKLSRNKIYIINRTYLERELIKKAETNSVKLYLGKRMKKYNSPNELILDNNKKITGKIIIDASGIVCSVGKQIGVDVRLKPEDIGICIQSRVQSHFDANTMYTWWHEPYAPFSYAWLFPINEKEANIGLGVKGGGKLDLKKLLEDYINFMTNGDYKIINTFRACEPMALPINPLVKNNVMFVGDAARLVDKVSGAGIHNAVFSGTLAGLIAAKYIHGEVTSLKVYQNAMKNRTDRIRKTYHRMRKLDTSDKFLKGFNRAFSYLHLINKIFPNFFQGHFAKIIKKDYRIIDLYK